MAKRSRPDPEPATIVNDEAEQNAAWLEDDTPRETRGEKKRKALQLERLGESLVKLPPAKLARVPLPNDLAAAVTEAQRIFAMGAHGGYRRQVQFIGRIMRTVDAQPIADALEALKGEDAPSSATFRAAERWRDRLVDEGDRALEELVKDKPEVDRTNMRTLIRQAQKEKANGKPPHASRTIFRELRSLFQASTESSSETETDDEE
jgi:ribosome-associated protein